MFDAGIVTFVPRGDWVNNVTYYPLNIVNYDGLSWIARRENVGQTPADGQYWQPNGTAVPIATTSVAGKVMPDGTSITVDQQGHISAVFSADLDDLDNVSITSPSNNQVLKYNATSQKWENGTDTGGLIPHLIIISETGSTVTVTKGAWSTTATETSTGHFECDVPEFGTYTIDAVLAGDDAQVSLVVDAVKIYTVDDSHFHADITVTFPSGATCSCGKEGETPTYATTSPHTFTVHSTGVYTVSATDGTSTATDTVTITTNGQTESVTLSFVPNGATVVPTDDIQTWLHCGNIWDKSYTTLAEVLADSTTLLALMSDSNAVDYLVRSKTWIGGHKALVPQMTSDTTPSGEVVYSTLYSSNNPPWYAFNSNEGVALLTGVSGAYVGYHFPQATDVRSVWVKNIPSSHSLATLGVATYKIQYSDNGTTWTDVGETVSIAKGGEQTTDINAGSHNYWIIRCLTNYGDSNVGLDKVQFYGASGIIDNATAMTDIGANNYCSNTLIADSDWCEGIANSQYIESVCNVKVPTMTSNTTPSGTCFGSSISSGYDYYKAFDNDASTAWMSSGSDELYKNPHIGYHFPSAIKAIIMKAITSSASTGTGTVYYKVQASNDNNTWDDLTNEKTYNGNGVDNLAEILSSSANYDYFRLYYTSTNTSSARATIASLQFYGREDV